MDYGFPYPSKSQLSSHHRFRQFQNQISGFKNIVIIYFFYLFFIQIFCLLKTRSGTWTTSMKTRVVPVSSFNYLKILRFVLFAFCVLFGTVKVRRRDFAFHVSAIPSWFLSVLLPHGSRVTLIQGARFVHEALRLSFL